MIARLFPTAHIAADAGSFKTLPDVGAEKKMIDAQSGIARERIPEVLPERVDAFVRIEIAHGIGPSRSTSAAWALRTSGRNSASSRQRSGA